MIRKEREAPPPADPSPRPERSKSMGEKVRFGLLLFDAGRRALSTAAARAGGSAWWRTAPPEPPPLLTSRLAGCPEAGEVECRIQRL